MCEKTESSRRRYECKSEFIPLWAGRQWGWSISRSSRRSRTRKSGSQEKLTERLGLVGFSNLTSLAREL